MDIIKRRVSSDLIEKAAKLQPEQYELSDKGNARLFADMYRDCLRYNSTAREWFYYNGQRWQQDAGGMIAENKAKELSDILCAYVNRIEDEAVRTGYMKHIAKLGSRRVRKTMIDDSRDLNFITNADMDKDLYLLNCQNGVLDLRTF